MRKKIKPTGILKQIDNSNKKLDADYEKAMKAERKRNTVVVIWGETASRKFDNEGEIDIATEDGAVNHYPFDTEVEKNAFIKGINEADGWYGSTILNESETTIKNNILKRKK